MAALRAHQSGYDEKDFSARTPGRGECPPTPLLGVYPRKTSPPEDVQEQSHAFIYDIYSAEPQTRITPKAHRPPRGGRRPGAFLQCNRSTPGGSPVGLGVTELKDRGAGPVQRRASGRRLPGGSVAGRGVSGASGSWKCRIPGPGTWKWPAGGNPRGCTRMTCTFLRPRLAWGCSPALPASGPWHGLPPASGLGTCCSLYVRDPPPRVHPFGFFKFCLSFRAEWEHHLLQEALRDPQTRAGILWLLHSFVMLLTADGWMCLRGYRFAFYLRPPQGAATSVSITVGSPSPGVELVRFSGSICRWSKEGRKGGREDTQFSTEGTEEAGMAVLSPEGVSGLSRREGVGTALADCQGR